MLIAAVQKETQERSLLYLLMCLSGCQEASVVNETSVPVNTYRLAFLRQNAMYETLHGADVETHGLQWGRGERQCCKPQ